MTFYKRSATIASTQTWWEKGKKVKGGGWIQSTYSFAIVFLLQFLQYDFTYIMLLIAWDLLVSKIHTHSHHISFPSVCLQLSFYSISSSACFSLIFWGGSPQFPTYILAEFRNHLFSLFYKVSKLKVNICWVACHDITIKVGYTHCSMKGCKFFPTQTNSILKLKWENVGRNHFINYTLSWPQNYTITIYCLHFKDDKLKLRKCIKIFPYDYIASKLLKLTTWRPWTEAEISPNPNILSTTLLMSLKIQPSLAKDMQTQKQCNIYRKAIFL